MYLFALWLTKQELSLCSRVVLIWSVSIKYDVFMFNVWALSWLSFSWQTLDLFLVVWWSLCLVCMHTIILFLIAFVTVFTASFVPLLFVVLLIIRELSAHCLHNVTSNCWVFFYYCIISGWHNVKYAKV